VDWDSVFSANLVRVWLTFNPVDFDGVFLS
jgi:hypothetical protein